MPRIEVLREVWRVTEWRDGSVYKTEYVEDRWASDTDKRPDNNPNLMWVVKGSDYDGPTIRRVMP